VAVALSAGPALLTTAEDEFQQIIRWYEEQLEDAFPPPDLEYEPIKIGPIWQWDNGWSLPEHTLGWRVLAWCGHWLRDKKGRPWQMTAEQTRFILWFFAVDEGGDFLYHSVVLQRLKGWGKDPIAACLTMAAMLAPVTFDHWDANGNPVGREEESAWVQIIAVSQKQTRNTMKLFPGMVPAVTRRYYGIQIGKTDIWALGDTRQAEAVTSNPDSIEGGRPTLVIRSETQNWTHSNSGFEMAGALEGNAAKAEIESPARMLDICNAHRQSEESVGRTMREAYETTAADEEIAAADVGIMYDSLEAPEGAPLTADAAPDVLKAVAGDSYWLDTRPTGRIVKSIINLFNSPSESRRKWYNSSSEAEDAWMKLAHWKAIGNKHVRPVPGARVVLFLDGSKSDDATALIGCEIETGNVFYVGIWQRPPKRDPKDPWIVNRELVDHRVRWACKHWEVLGLWVDPSDARDDVTGERFWETYADDWADIQDWELWAVPRGDNKHPTIWDMRSPRHAAAHTAHAERFVTDVKERRFYHDAHKMLEQHVRNARLRPGKYGVGLGKERRGSPRKVDGAVAAVGARLMRKTWFVLHPEPSGEAMFV
jgi:hypothetical protein